MRGGFTFEERVALWVLAALLAGLVCVDGDYVYISVGTNAWKRAALGW